MARVLVARQPWGTLWEKAADRQLSVPASGTGASINTTVYSAATGSGTVASFVTNTDGELPGWVEEGTHTLTVNSVATQVEAVSSTSVLTVRDEKLNLEDTRVGGSIATALSMLPLSGTRKTGTIVLPPGKSYDITTLINLDDCAGLKIEGEGGRPGLPQLKWKGAAGSGPMIRFNSALGLQLRNLVLSYDSAAYNGDLISCDHSATALDPKQFLMENCYIGGIGGAAGAASLFRPNKLIISTLRGNTWQDAVVGIKKGPDYVTTLNIEGQNDFARFSNCAILNPGDVWTIIGNTFEPKADGTACGIGHDLNFWTNVLTLVGNYFGDVTAGAGTWVKLRCAGSTLANYMTSPGPAAGSTHYYIDSSFGVTVGGFCDGGTNGIDFRSALATNEGIEIGGMQNTAATRVANPANARYSDNSYRSGNDNFVLNGKGLTLGGVLDHDGTTAGFYGAAPVAKPTGVAVTAAGIHAALVSLGLIAA